MATLLEDIVYALESMGGSGRLRDIYDVVEKRRANSTDSLPAMIRRTIQDHSSDSAGYKHRQDLFFSLEGLGGGVWGLRSHLENSPKAVDLGEGNAAPSRAHQSTYRILRDTAMARRLKVLHENCCQVCGKTIRLPNGATYSEAHHVRPLGAPHNGPDTPDNILIVCPNHHVMLDYGAMTIPKDGYPEIKGHKLDPAVIKYHNTKVFRNAV